MDRSSSRKKDWVLTQEAFDGLLGWLDADRERAAEKYERIRSNLIRGFKSHGCPTPEELADETINRVARRLPEIVETYVGEPASYFFGVAHNVRLEYLRKKPAPLHVTLREPDDDDIEPEYECLEHCLEFLTPQKREIILQYYQGEKHIKIELRKAMARRLGVNLATLRLQASRIRAVLKECILDCLSRGGGE